MAGDSVTRWISQLKAGDPSAANKLWECYFQRLVALAGNKLRGMPRRAADEEDVALSAFNTFCRGVGRGQFPQLEDRDNLWRLLVTITARKAIDLIHHERRQKRGGAVAESELASPSAEAPAFAFEQVISREPTPEFAAQVAEECRRLLDRLDDAELRALAVWKMEGYSNDEIAAKLGCVPRTVERRLRVIRSLWAQEIAQ
jgi:DNA-directed RNA polymerase specialized sigma24 family protein